MLDSPNWSRRPFGTHPVNLVSLMSRYSRFSSFANSGGISPVNPFSWRASCTRLARLPSSGGISPLIWFGPKDRVVTRPLSSVPTPFHSPIGKSVSHLSLLFQFGPSVALYRAIRVSRSVFRARSALAGVWRWPWAWATVRRLPLSARWLSVRKMPCSEAHRWPVLSRAGLSARRWAVPRMAYPSAHQSRRRPAAATAEAVQGQRFPGKVVSLWVSRAAASLMAWALLWKPVKPSRTTGGCPRGRPRRASCARPFVQSQPLVPFPASSRSLLY